MISQNKGMALKSKRTAVWEENVACGSTVEPGSNGSATNGFSPKTDANCQSLQLVSCFGLKLVPTEWHP